METRPEPHATAKTDLTVRPLREEDLPAADRILRLAFGTFLGLPEPGAFLGDADYVRGRWRTDPDAAFGAERGGELVGSNFATNWGSVGFFGPLTVRPDLWDSGVGKRLMEPVMECFEAWGTRHAGLFTFAQSQKHVGLYQKFGFWPRFLTAILSRPVGPAGGGGEWSHYSDLAEGERGTLLEACHALTNEIYEGLNVGREIQAVARQGLGDTVLLWNGDRLAGLAICHAGPGTEAGSGTCLVKFGAARPGGDARKSFDALLDACEEYASRRGLTRLTLGVNTARHEAYRALLERRFRTDTQGIAMQRPNDAGYNRPGVFLIDDWR